MAGLTSKGFEIERFPTLLENLEGIQQATINPNINTRDDELLGQFNNILTASDARNWELMQAIYDAFNIDKAEGKNLDDLAALRGVVRIDNSLTQGIQLFTGVDGTIVPENTVIANPINNDRFRLLSTLTLSSLSCYNCSFSITTVIDATTYTITANNTVYAYTSGVDATLEEILAGLKARIDLDISITFSATVADDRLVLQTTSDAVVSAYTITYIKAQEVTVRGVIVAEEVGDIVAPLNSVTSIVTPVTGLTSTTNLNQLSIGRLKETDEEFRLRIPIITSTGSTGTIPSIESALLSNIAGITSVKVVDNTLAVPDEKGRPAHSYEIIIVGGGLDEIGQEVWRTKPAGIGTVGNTNILITDSNGTIRSVYVTRPVAVYLACRVQYGKYSEELFPAAGETTMEATVYDFINRLGVDNDVIPNRVLGAILNDVTGIDELIIEVQVISASGAIPDPLLWQSARLPIAGDEFPNIETTDITILEL